MSMENLVLQKHIPLITPSSKGKKTGYKMLDIVEYHNKDQMNFYRLNEKNI